MHAPQNARAAAELQNKINSILAKASACGLDQGLTPVTSIPPVTAQPVTAQPVLPLPPVSPVVAKPHSGDDGGKRAKRSARRETPEEPADEQTTEPSPRTEPERETETETETVATKTTPRDETPTRSARARDDLSDSDGWPEKPVSKPEAVKVWWTNANGLRLKTWGYPKQAGNDQGLWYVWTRGKYKCT